jgi:hypothetical protein
VTDTDSFIFFSLNREDKRAFNRDWQYPPTQPIRSATRTQLFIATIIMFSQNSSSRRPNNPDGLSGKVPAKKTSPKLYRPAVYSYMCHGYYFAASDQESAAGPGACRGITGKLAVMENQGLMTRTEALKRFATMSADDIAPDGDEGEMQQQAIYMSPVLVFQNHNNHNNHNNTGAVKKNDDDDNEDDGGSLISKFNADDRLPTEELIKRDTYECYGSTEVEYLLLEDADETKATHFAAVGPRTTGVSFRQVDTEDSVRQITRIGLGWLQIILDSNTTTTMEDDDIEPQQGSTSKVRGDEETNAVVPDRLSALQLFDKPNQERLLYFFNFCEKVGQHTEMNATWLVENLRDDFPRRTYQAGTRIVAELPRICHMTATNMGKIIRRMLGDDFDED